jgi:hypothetical protein
MSHDDPTAATSAEPLSHAGERRRDAILSDALRHAGRRRLKRRVIPAAGAALAVALGAWMAVASLRPATPAMPGPVAHLDPRQPARQPPAPVGAAPDPVVVVQIARPDPQLVERIVVRPAPSLVTRVDDEQMLTLLAGAGKPAGFSKVDGRTVVLFREDEEH